MKFIGEIMTDLKKVGIFLLFGIIYSQDYFNVEIPGTGVSQPLIFSGEFNSLEPGDEIGVFDLNGITNYSEDCSNLSFGPVLVGSGVWTGEVNDQGNALAISLIGSTYSGDVPSCDFGGFATAGYVVGNDIVIHVWSAEVDQEYAAEVGFSVGNGQFGLIPSFDVVSSLSWTVEEISGCTDPEALNYDPLATLNDDSCEYAVPGCTDETAFNFNSEATADDGSCEYLGCTDLAALNYNPDATLNDGSCEYPVSGCTDNMAVNYDSDASEDDGSCEYLSGCTDPAAQNYFSDAIEDDGSCFYGIEGCTNSLSLNYNPDALIDDGSCDVSLYITIDNVDVNNGTMDINMVNPVPIAGFQFDISGLENLSASGGSASDAGFTISASSTTVLGFSFSGAVIDAGNTILTTLSFLNAGSIDACLSNGVYSDSDGNTLENSTDGCFSYVVVTASSDQEIILDDIVLDEEVSVDIDIPAGGLDAEEGESVEIEVNSEDPEEVEAETADGSASVDVEAGLTIEAGDVELNEGESIEVTITFETDQSRDCPDVIMAYVVDGIIVPLDPPAICTDAECTGDINQFGTIIVGTETEDCNGECGGTAYLDICDSCVDGSSGGQPGEALDCNGFCYGPGGIDELGECCGSAQFIDDCGVCSDSESGHSYNSDLDCNGSCFGGSVLDCEGICNGQASLDCSGVCNGTAAEQCCIGGDDDSCCLESDFADYDCSGACDGSSDIDIIGECCDQSLIDSETGLCPAVDVPGCTDFDAVNYNIDANIDDGSCLVEPNGWGFIGSTSQALYSITNIYFEIDGESVELGEGPYLIGAFNGEVGGDEPPCVGYALWGGSDVETFVSVNGNDFVTNGTQDYLMYNDIPDFRLYDFSNDQTYYGTIDACITQFGNPSNCAYAPLSYFEITALSMSVDQFSNSSIQFVAGNNLFSFGGLPELANAQELLETIDANVNFLIGQGVGLFNTGVNPDGSTIWSGNLNEVDQFSGYWINIDQSFAWDVLLNSDVPECMDYYFAAGNNLVSYVGPDDDPDHFSAADALGLGCALPEADGDCETYYQDYFNFAIGQGVGLFNTTLEGETTTWSGNLNYLSKLKGYWVNIESDWPLEGGCGLAFRWNIDPVSEGGLGCDAPFPENIDCPSLMARNSSQASISEEFRFVQSTEQAFYLVESVSVDGREPSENDLLLAYCNDFLAGSVLWGGANTPVPVMGRDLSDETFGFCEDGDDVDFMLYDASRGQIIPLEGESQGWGSLLVSNISSLNSVAVGLPGELGLNSAYPNPFNPVTSINFSIPNESYITMRIYDISGRLVAELIDGVKKQGMYTVEWNAASESSGLYLLKLSNGDEIKTDKLILVK